MENVYFAVLLALHVTERSGVSRRAESCVAAATNRIFVAYLHFERSGVSRRAESRELHSGGKCVAKVTNHRPSQSGHRE